MSKKDFFTLLIKGFGLYSLVLTLFQFLPSLLSYVQFDLEITSLIIIALPLAIVVALFLFLIFKSENIISWLKLDKGFEKEDITLGELNQSQVIAIIVLILSGVLLLDNIPYLLLESFLGFKQIVQTKGIQQVIDDSTMQRFNLHSWVIAFINVIIGIVLLSNVNRVSNWLTRVNESNKEESL